MSAPTQTRAKPSSRASDDILVLEGISLSFAGVKALTDVGFSVERSEICAVIGPNGAGKSSLLNVLSGVYRPDQGQITFDGFSAPRLHPGALAARGLGRTFQHLASFKGMSVLDNVLAGLASRARTTFFGHALRTQWALREEDEQRAQAEAALEFLRLQPYRDVLVSTLPYGIQKRVDLARALSARPKLLLLDEPMAGMNHDEKDEMRRVLTEVNDVFGTTLVLIEHDMGIVMQTCDHVVVLDGGKKIADGVPDEVRRDPRVIRAYLGIEA